MEASMLRWIDFKVMKLEAVRQNLENQMQVFAAEIADLDYEISVLKDAKMEGSFVIPP